MGLIFDIKRYAINDGPGIRTTIFMKGCPLRCVWCHNPEGQHSEAQLLYAKQKCIGCATCVEICPNEALNLTPDGIKSRQRQCTLCGRCAEECPTKALEISGKEWDLSTLMEVIEKERIVMEKSGGGVTVCGGEPLFHPDYLMLLLDELGKRGLHRCVDTTLFASEEIVRQVVENCELLLVDYKIHDSDKHRQYTGVPNERILSNIKMIAEMRADFFVRIPLIEGVNADEGDIAQTAQFLAQLPWKRRQVNLLPYHDIGKGKHERLGTTYNPGHFTMMPPSEATLQRCIKQFESVGIRAVIGG